MSWSLINHTRILGSAGPVSSPIDTITIPANLLVVLCANFGASASSTGFTLTDSQSNTWHSLTNHVQTNNNCAIWYSFDKGGLALSLSGTHTINVTGANGFSETSFWAFSGSLGVSGSYDVDNGANNAGVSTIQTGSITPSQNGSLLVSIYSSNQTTGVQTISDGVNTWAVIDASPQVGGTAIGQATAWAVQATAAAVNPTWSDSGGTGNNAAAIAAFKPAAGASRGLFLPPSLSGLGSGGSFFHNPLN